METKEAWQLLQDALVVGGTNSADFLKLVQRPSLSNRDIAGILAFFMKVGLPPPKTPATALVDAFFLALGKLGSNGIQWEQVTKSISVDFPQLKPIKSPQEFSSVLVAAWKRSRPDQQQPVPGLLFTHNADLLAMAVQCDEVKFEPNTWGSVPAVQAMLEFAETSPQVAHLLNTQGKYRNPDLLLLSLLHCNTSAAHSAEAENMREELYAFLVPQLLNRAAGLVVGSTEMDTQIAFRVLRQVWHTNRELVLRGVIELFPKQFEIIQVILRLPDGLELLLSLPTRYSLAACFFSFEQFDLEKWLAEKAISSVEPKPVFVRETLQFILAYQQTNLNRHFVSLLFRVLHIALTTPNHDDAAAGEQEQLIQEVRAVLEQCRTVDPMLLPPPQPQQSQQQQQQPQQQQQSYDDVEEQANARFQMIYSGEMDIDEAVQMLARFKDSAVEREQAIFACMIHNLFDEYRFFSDYPDKELRITAVFFGKLIQNQVVSSWTLSMAIKYVLDALRSRSDKNFAFGLLALQQFLPRLPTMLHVVDDLLGIPHLRQLDPSMYSAIEQIKRGSSTLPAPPPGHHHHHVQQQEPISQTQLASMAAVFDHKPTTINESYPLRGSESGETLALFAAKLDRIMFPLPPGLDQAPASPSNEIKDQVQFLINNLIPANVDEKVTQAKRIFTPSNFAWVAHTLVNGRVTSQSNYHLLYMEFLDKIGEKELLRQVRLHTLLLVRKLLLSTKLVSSPNERSVLKSLGSWLGMLTLAKNKPLLHVELDLKELIVDGYERGWLIAIIPFVAKILEGAKDSKAFLPATNPWIRGILGCLAEIYRLPDVKLNLKFEMEVLALSFEVTGMDMSSITPTNLLSSRNKPKLVGNPDFTIKPPAAAQVSSPPTNAALPPNAFAVGANRAGPGLLPNNNSTVPFAQPSAGSNNSFPSNNAQQYYDARSAGGGAATDKASAFETMIPGVHMYVFVNSALPLFVKYPELKSLVPVAFDRAIREIIQPAVERSVTISTYTTKELVTKDFAMEPNEQRMQRAAHLMASNLAGALALMTCKELLKSSMAIHLRQLFSHNSVLQQDDAALLDSAIRTCCEENLELGCMLIEKAATEKAARDIDEHLEMAYQNRKDHRAQTSDPFFDASIFNTGGRYPASLPAGARPSPRESGLSAEHLQVYEAFQKPRSPPPTINNASQDLPTTAAPPPPSLLRTASNMPSLTAPQALERYKQVVATLDVAVQKLLQQPGFYDLPTSMLPADHEILVQLGMVRSIVASTVVEARFEVAVVLAQSVFKRLYDGSPTDKLRLSVQVGALDAISTALEEQGLKNKITEWVLVSIKSGKLNVAVTCALIHSRLINVLAMDEFLSEALYFQQQQEGNSNGVSPIVSFTLELIQRCVVLSRSWQVCDCQRILNVLRKFTANGVPPGLPKLFNDVSDVALQQQSTAAPIASLPASANNNNSNPSQQQASAAVAAAQYVKDSAPRMAWTRNVDIPVALRDAVQYALQIWLEVFRDGTSAAPFLQFVGEKQLLHNDSSSELFFFILTELCIESYLEFCCTPREEEEANGEDAERQMRMAYFGIDSYIAMVVFFVKLSAEQGRPSIAALVLESIARVMGQDMSQRMIFGYELAFDQRPYFRLLLNLQREVLALGGAEMLAVFAEALHLYFPPERCPGFCFSWLELVSHNSLMPRLLRMEREGGWVILHELLLDLFRFLDPFLLQASLTPSVRQLYKGTLRVLLVLLHDFPEFLCFYHFSLCNVIPPSCVQLRNLILSAFPRTMRLPDPFTRDLKVDLLAEIEIDPKVLSNVTLALEYTANGNLKQELDTFLSTKAPQPFLSTLKQRVMKEKERTGTWDCLNSLVLYVGSVSIARAKETASKSGGGAGGDSMSSFAISKDIYQTLALELQGEARYMLLNAIANHLRYPNSHTHFFSCVILGLFKDVPEQVTRVLLERLIVHRPHPWGLLVTFIELMKNPRYSFWEHSFTRCTPEIQKVFESVASSCGAVQQQQQAM